MSNPTITKSGVTFTFQDGDCDNVSIRKSSNLDVTPIPGGNSDDAFVIDFNGVTKTITLTGQLTPATSSRTSTGSTLTIAEQMDWLLDLIDGNQATGFTLSTTFQSSKTVFCQRLNFNEEGGNPNQSPFTIEFVEGS